MTSTFNPIDYALRLESEGVPANQANVHARALADALSNCTVHPQDLLELSNSFNGRMFALENGMLNLRKDMDAGFAKVDVSLAHMDAKFAGFQGQLDKFQGQIDNFQSQIKMLKWMLGFVVALQTGMLLKAFL